MKSSQIHRKNRHRLRYICKGLTAVVFALTNLASCDDAPSNVVEGVDAPMVLQRSDVRVSGTSESIAVVVDLEVLPDGSVWVLNSVEPFFIGFGPDGSVLHEYGSRGGGPEEFGTPVGFVPRGIGGAAWIFDVRRHALIEISRPGSARTEISLPRNVLPPGSLMSGFGFLSPQVRTARLGEEIILARSSGSLSSGVLSLSRTIYGADLVALDPSTDSVRGVAALGSLLADPAAYLESLGALPPVLLWFRLWTVCSGRELRVYDRFRNEMRGFSADGTELEAITLPPVSVTEASAEQFARAIFALVMAEAQGQVGGGFTAADSIRVINETVQEMEWDPAQIAEVLPRYVDLRCGEEGTLWLQPFDPEMGGLRGGTAWLRITPGGVSQEIHLPERFDPYRFTSERIWGVLRDELDVASVAWIEAPSIR